jgi:DNA-binding transcriptional regulator YiaG
MNESDVIQFPLAHAKCPSCERNTITTQPQVEEFPYGDGASAVILTATVPVHTCANCGIEYTGREAEVIRHEAVCVHLGVLPPRLVKEIRKKFGSRTEFSRLTGIGEASIGRWEAGLQIQNLAMDLLLRLVSEPQNRRFLKSRSRLQKHSPSKRFPAIRLTPDLETAAARFSLRCMS